MGINVKIRTFRKSTDAILKQVNLEKELKSCMRCKYFYGNNSQCISKKCVREGNKPQIMAGDSGNSCIGCSYRQTERYCFPCMKKLLAREGD